METLDNILWEMAKERGIVIFQNEQPYCIIPNRENLSNHNLTEEEFEEHSECLYDFNERYI